MLHLQRHLWSWKLVALAGLFLGVLLVVTMSNKANVISEMIFNDGGTAQAACPRVQTLLTRTEFVNNSGAAPNIKAYRDLFASTTPQVSVPANPNNRSTITTWWQALAMIDWYMKAPVRYACKNKKPMGNWWICQDEPYTIKPPCLVYSFGINWEFGFDDAMVRLGCEVHMFDPSMKEKDHMRGNATFHNIGIGSYNTDAFVPRRDIYVKDRQTWKLRTVKSIMNQLGHQNRVIDVFKMDVETTEWTVMDNMLETDVFKFIRHFNVEYHLFKDYPLPEEYVHIYQLFTRLRETGFKEYHSHQHQRKIKPDSFRYQADVAYVNAFFDNTCLGR